MYRIFLDIAVILIFTKIGGIISNRLQMTEVLGALIACVVICIWVVCFIITSKEVCRRKT